MLGTTPIVATRGQAGWQLWGPWGWMSERCPPKNLPQKGACASSGLPLYLSCSFGLFGQTLSLGRIQAAPVLSPRRAWCVLIGSRHSPTTHRSEALVKNKVLKLQFAAVLSQFETNQEANEDHFYVNFTPPAETCGLITSCLLVSTQNSFELQMLLHYK